MKKKKLNLDELEITSFVTSINHRNKGTIRGMFGGLTALECESGGTEEDPNNTQRQHTKFLCIPDPNDD